MARLVSSSLRRRYRRRPDVPLLLVASAALIAAGLTLPAFETRTLILWHSESSILGNIRSLWRQDKHVAAAVLAACSVVYPALKVAALTWFWLLPFPHRWRHRAILFFRVLGRWAMLDVFTILAIVIASLTIGPLEATPRVGLYLYAAGIIGLMYVALQMSRLARRSRS